MPCFSRCCVGNRLRPGQVRRRNRSSGVGGAYWQATDATGYPAARSVHGTAEFCQSGIINSPEMLLRVDNECWGALLQPIHEGYTCSI
jgi:hypothetical protein